MLRGNECANNPQLSKRLTEQGERPRASARMSDGQKHKIVHVQKGLRLRGSREPSLLLSVGTSWNLAPRGLQRVMGAPALIQLKASSSLLGHLRPFTQSWSQARVPPSSSGRRKQQGARDAAPCPQARDPGRRACPLGQKHLERTEGGSL